jgi:hypothetical protein
MPPNASAERWTPFLSSQPADASESILADFTNMHKGTS